MDILPPLPTLLAFIGAAFVLVVTPGPVVLYIVARSVDQGRGAGLASVLGAELGNAVHVLAAALGLSAILVSSALAFDVVKYLGAAYLIYLGVKALRTPVKTVEDPVFQRKSLRSIFGQGFIVAVLNPKTALFFLAFLPQFIDPASQNAAAQILALGVVMLAMATLSDSLYALAAGALGGWMRRSPAFLKVQRLLTGFTYIFLGVSAAFASRSR
ncbi:MAG: LysE family translocator [Anaerolineae bacterium]|nr:LysE family translocator [Anaerolineae bacterium]